METQPKRAVVQVRVIFVCADGMEIENAPLDAAYEHDCEVIDGLIQEMEEDLFLTVATPADEAGLRAALE